MQYSIAFEIYKKARSASAWVWWEDSASSSWRPRCFSKHPAVHALSYCIHAYPSLFLDVLSTCARCISSSNKTLSQSPHPCLAMALPLHGKSPHCCYSKKSGSWREIGLAVSQRKLSNTSIACWVKTHIDTDKYAARNNQISNVKIALYSLFPQGSPPARQLLLASLQKQCS